MITIISLIIQYIHIRDMTHEITELIYIVKLIKSLLFDLFVLVKHEPLNVACILFQLYLNR